MGDNELLYIVENQRIHKERVSILELFQETKLHFNFFIYLFIIFFAASCDEKYEILEVLFSIFFFLLIERNSTSSM